MLHNYDCSKTDSLFLINQMNFIFDLRSLYSKSCSYPLQKTKLVSKIQICFCSKGINGFIQPSHYFIDQRLYFFYFINFSLFIFSIFSISFSIFLSSPYPTQFFPYSPFPFPFFHLPPFPSPFPSPFLSPSF